MALSGPNPSSAPMNLVVATRNNGPVMRFEVEGRWRNGDALKLAYLVKAALARMRQDHAVIDLRRVATPPDAQGKFMICDRLRRALAPNIRVGLVAARDLVDCDEPAYASQMPDVEVFDAERDAIDWLSLQKAA